MFKNNSVKIQITEQRVIEYVLIFSFSFSFGIWVRANVFFSAQFIVDTSRIFNVFSKCFPSGCLPFTKIVQVVCPLQKYLRSSNLFKNNCSPNLCKTNFGNISLRSSSICKNISGCLPFRYIFEVVFPLQKNLRSSSI
jgi:hypothetical protein